MSWKVRHEGSPQSVEGLTVEQVVEGLQDGHWETTDEVMGPHDTAWAAIEEHPQFAEIAADIEPLPPREQEDETRLDMNALIDVCLVLLIFFIIITSYSQLQKMLDSPNLTGDTVQGPVRLTKEQVEKSMIRVKVTGSGKDVVIRVEDQVVPNKDDLIPMLGRFVQNQRKTELLIEHDREVPHGTIVAIEDAAKGAHISKVLILVPKEELTR